MVIADKVVPGGIDFEQQVLDWVIAGGESGRDARPMHPAGLDRCAISAPPAALAFCLSNGANGRHRRLSMRLGNPRSGWQANRAHPPYVAKAEELYPEAGAAFIERVGKKAAGRLLDGVEHNGFPTRERSNGV
jgi:hypothetical protein